eukprot:767162-Hanusia_phi.AAC.5
MKVYADNEELNVSHSIKPTLAPSACVPVSLGDLEPSEAVHSAVGTVTRAAESCTLRNHCDDSSLTGPVEPLILPDRVTQHCSTVDLKSDGE